jgi:hypothetical protein
MQRVVPTLLFIFVSLLAGCAGTGSKNYSQVNAAVHAGIATLPSTFGQALILREKAWTGAGALISVSLNDKKVGQLGNGEILIETVNRGQNIIKAEVEGIQGIGLNTATYNFSNNGESNNFFIVGIKTGLLNNQLTITETVEASWKSAQSD